MNKPKPKAVPKPALEPKLESKLKPKSKLKSKIESKLESKLITREKSGWVLVWQDEFEGDRVDPAKWDFDLGNGFYDYRSNVWIAGWGNEELQYYTAEPTNVTVKDSLLTIRAVKESLHGCGYTSARLKTKKRDGTLLFSTLYGRVEFRAKVPWGKGM